MNSFRKSGLQKRLTHSHIQYFVGAGKVLAVFTIMLGACQKTTTTYIPDCSGAPDN